MSLALLIGTRAQVDKLVASYAIGVFTGFTLAGFGMAKYYRRRPESKNRRRKMALNVTSGAVSAVVVIVFAVATVTEGAWIVLILFPVGVFSLFRLNRQYRLEARTLRTASPEMGRAKIVRHSVVVLVDNADLATVAAVRYATSLGASRLRAVHVVLDETQADELLVERSQQTTLSRVPLDFVACRDRRLVNGVVQLAVGETADRGTELTLVLPRRTYARFLGRILHDHTADQIARAISEQPRVVATVIPFDVDGLIERRHRARALRDAVPAPRALTPAMASATVSTETWDRTPEGSLLRLPDHERSSRPTSDVTWQERATVSGQVRSVRLAAVALSPSFEVELWDESGGVILVLRGRRSIPGIRTGTATTASGAVGEQNGKIAIANPIYRLEPPDED